MVKQAPTTKLDLGIPWNTSVEYQKKMMALLIRLGFDGCAWTVKVDGNVSTQHKCNIAPHVPTEEDCRNWNNRCVLRTRDPPSKFHSLTRLHVFADAPEIHALNNNAAICRTYDIVSVEPKNEKAFLQAVETPEIDIITFNLADRLPFKISHSQVGVAMQKGIHFEIKYSHAFQAGQSRRNFLSGAAQLVRLTRGRNVLITSGAEDMMHLRGPADVANMSTLFGIHSTAAKHAVQTVPHQVVTHGRVRKAYRGVLMVEDINDEAEETKETPPNKKPRKD